MTPISGSPRPGRTRERHGSDQAEWAGDLADSIEKITRTRPARHVLARLTALLYPAKPEFVDASFTAQESFFVNGQIVVFTEDVVAVATVTKMRPMEEFRDEPHEESTVSIRVVARSSLKAIDLAPVDVQTAVNSSPIWQLRSGDLTEWPYLAAVSLVYPDLVQPLVAPSVGENEAFLEFVPTLVADLSK